MFLNDLSTPLQKALFLELATLMMMAAGDSNTSSKVKNSDLSNASPSLQALLQYINESEKSMLLEYQNEMFRSSSSLSSSSLYENLVSSYIDGSYDAPYDAPRFLKYIFGNAINSFKADLDTSHIEFNCEADLNTSKTFPAFGKILEQAIKEILEKYAADAAIKQEVMQQLLADGEDIMSLTPPKIQAAMIRLPLIRQEILVRSVYWLITPKQTIGLDLSVREKKIVLFELIGAGFSSGAFEQAEKDLLKVICTALHVDEEYIDEFTDVMGKIFTANKEAAELINE